MRKKNRKLELVKNSDYTAITPLDLVLCFSTMDYLSITSLDNKTFGRVLEVWKTLLQSNPDASIHLAHAKVVSELRRHKTCRRESNRGTKLL